MASIPGLRVGETSSVESAVLNKTRDGTNGRIRSIGVYLVSHNLDGTISKVGTQDVQYDFMNGHIRKIGDADVEYHGNGYIKSVGSDSVTYLPNGHISFIGKEPVFYY